MAYSVDGEIKLIKRKTSGKDSRGNPLYTTQKRGVLAKIESTPQSEFFNAGQSGIQSEFIFKVNPIEYQGERLVEYEGEELKIYRKYRSEVDVLELYAGKEIG